MPLFLLLTIPIIIVIAWTIRLRPTGWCRLGRIWFVGICLIGMCTAFVVVQNSLYLRGIIEYEPIIATLDLSVALFPVVAIMIVALGVLDWEQGRYQTPEEKRQEEEERESAPVYPDMRIGHGTWEAKAERERETKLDLSELRYDPKTDKF